jgi:hypothetical protein
MVTARCGDHTRGRHFPLQQVGEGASRLERSGVLQQLEFEAEPDGGRQTKIR